MSTRRVVLLCGPPGAGKSTRAATLHGVEQLRVLDRDDPQWNGRDREFLAAMARVGDDPAARVVVIRSCPTAAARTAAARLLRATAVELLLPPPEVCRQRVRDRHREDWRRSLAGIASWFAAYTPDDPDPVAAVAPSREW